MRVCIHRGTEQIGGTCVELEAEGKRILLDLGRPLDVADGDAAASVPRIVGLQEGSADLLAILISHPHQDHVGLVEFVPESIPVAIGKAAAALLDRAANWLSRPLLAGRTLINWEDRRPVKIGPFVVTPFLVDHSAYDAYALLIEAGGQRLFYSGDFRGHGRKAKLFDRLIAAPPPNVDMLLMEGTVIGRDGEERQFPSEDELEVEFVDKLQGAQGLSLLWTSSQNLDRIVTVFRAARRTGRRLILDLFTAEMLAATDNPRLPQADWRENIGIYVPKWMRRKITQDGSFDVLKRFKANRVFLDQLADPAYDILLFRPGLLKEVDAEAPLGGAQLLYSNWSGYLADPSTLLVRQWIEARQIPMHTIHTSGHASLPDLRRFAAALAPRALIPIHSFHTDRFGELFENVVRMRDGVWFGMSAAIAALEVPIIPPAAAGSEVAGWAAEDAPRVLSLEQ
ncbi:MAG: MBL fold metallo-hydrolase [Xanthomonadales bacterium]|nr:MBL fold metallo-hydrolase [Xanthomonadales bacterium]